MSPEQRPGWGHPADVSPREGRGVPGLQSFTAGVAEYVSNYEGAIGRGSRGYERKVEALWGIVAQGRQSLPWVETQLASGVRERIADAGGVLGWIGFPDERAGRLLALAQSLPDSEEADSLLEAIALVMGPEPAETSPPASELLFDGAFLPFTEPIWFVEAPFEQVRQGTIDWLSGLGDRVFTDLHEPLLAMLGRLEPWAMPSWKALIVETRGDWTAIFSQASDIYIHEVVGRTLGLSRMRTHYSPRVVRAGKTVSHGDCALWWHGADNETKRTVQATSQSRWQWELYGTPFPFEDLDAYSAKRIPDRFTLARLNDYCRALGVNRNDPAFYADRGMLISHTPGEAWGSRRMTAEEWREHYR